MNFEHLAYVADSALWMGAYFGIVWLGWQIVKRMRSHKSM